MEPFLPKGPETLKRLNVKDLHDPTREHHSLKVDVVLLMASLHVDSSLLARLDKLDRSRVVSGDGSVLGKVLGLSVLGIGYSAWC